MPSLSFSFPLFNVRTKNKSFKEILTSCSCCARLAAQKFIGFCMNNSALFCFLMIDPNLAQNCEYRPTRVSIGDGLTEHSFLKGFSPNCEHLSIYWAVNSSIFQVSHKLALQSPTAQRMQAMGEHINPKEV